MLLGWARKYHPRVLRKVQTQSKYIVPKWECQECARKTTCNFVYRNISENSIDCMFKHWNENLKRVLKHCRIFWAILSYKEKGNDAAAKWKMNKDLYTFCCKVKSPHDRWRVEWMCDKTCWYLPFQQTCQQKTNFILLLHYINWRIFNG